MSNTLLYLIATLIWGSTWLAITFQLGVVPPELSVVYRFLLASLILFAYSGLRGLTLRFTFREHLFIALQGALLFSANYVMVYVAEIYVNSGIVAVLFSSATLFTNFFAFLFLKTSPRANVLAGSFVGIAGLVLIFWPELVGLDLRGGPLLGFALALGSAISAALGNIVSARNHKANLPVVQTVAYGMLYGSLLTFGYALVRGVPLIFDSSVGYVTSLLYLAVFGSVISFVSYLTLLGRIGPDRSSYIAVIIPVIALILSALFEGLRLNAFQLVGASLVIVGNVIVLAKKKPAVQPASP